jgi:hypothetical protein
VKNLPKLARALLSLTSNKLTRIRQKLLQRTSKVYSENAIRSTLLRTIRAVTREVRTRRRGLNALIRSRRIRPRGTKYRLSMLRRANEAPLQKKERALWYAKSAQRVRKADRTVTP